jgi:hypothetical protein
METTPVAFSAKITLHTEYDCEQEETVVELSTFIMAISDKITLTGEYDCQENLKIWNTEGRTRMRSQNPLLRSNEKQQPVEDTEAEQIRSVAYKPPEADGSFAGTRSTSSATG